MGAGMLWGRGDWSTGDFASGQVWGREGGSSASVVRPASTHASPLRCGHVQARNKGDGSQGRF